MALSKEKNVDRFHKAVSDKRINMPSEDFARKIMGVSTIAGAVTAMVVSETARQSYGQMTAVLGGGFILWRTGMQSL
jgi:hypothetical protein